MTVTERGVSDIAYGVGYLPGRKRIALYRSCGARVNSLAYFDDESEAREFMAFIDRLARLDSRSDTIEWHGWAEVRR